MGRDMHASAAMEVRAASATMQLKKGGRLCFPADVLKILGWKGPPQAVKLIAELVTPGYVKLYKRDAIEEKLEVKRAKLAKEAAVGDSEALKKLKVFVDRYRPVSLQKEKRVHLTESVIVFLGARPKDLPYFFIQAANCRDEIEIMSIDKRNELMEELGEDEDVAL